jgi:cyclopropane fatty-acyl-phospholipid synthase-like methyltransferase
MDVLDFGCGTGLLTVALQPLGGGERVFTVFLMTGRKGLPGTLGVRAK